MPLTDTARLWLSGAGVALLAGCSTPAIDPMTQQTPNTPAAPVDCSLLATNFVATGLVRPVRITSAEPVPAGVTVPGMAQPTPMPAHCKVTGKIDERLGQDGRPYAISFELRMPVNWAGRFLLQANGGNDGVVQPAFGNVSAGATTNALLQGFAVVSSDGGHATLPPQTSGADGVPVGLAGGNLFGLDPQARLDYGYQANGALAPTAKKLIAAYYGEPVRKSYLMGCSNGGRQGMVAASRYASEFDGILAGNPGFNLPKSAVQHAWDIQSFSAVNPDIKAAFPPEDMQLVARKVLEKCDALDGLADGMVNDLAACQKAFDIKDLQCAAGKTDAQTGQCLSAPQVTALQKVFAGPRNSKGDALYSDWPWDAGVGASQIGFGSWRAWKLEGPAVPTANLPIIGVMGAGSLAYIFSTPSKPVSGNPPALLKSLLDYNFDSDAPSIYAAQGGFTESAMQFMTPPNATELSTFEAKGGKLIVYHGTSDPVFSFNDTRNWYDSLNKNHGAKANSFARLFPVPGMNHCQGGPATEQFDLLTPLVNWVEKGQAPQRVVATARPGVNPDVPVSWTTAGKPRTRPLCAYPTQVRYSGSGDINDAGISSANKLPGTIRAMRKSSVKPAHPVDTNFLETLMGYNTRRAALVIIGLFLERMAQYDLRPVDFSVLSLILHNPGITSRQLCSTLNILPPNLVGMINALEKRALVERVPHPSDGRAMGLHLTPGGITLTEQAELTAATLEQDATPRLTPAERKTLMRLLQKIYL